MKLFHPKLSLVSSRCVGTILAFSVVSMTIAQTVSLNPDGDRIIRFDDGTWRYYEGKDSALLQSVPIEEKMVTTVNQPEEIQTTDTIIYDYRLFTKYVAAAVKYESQMLDKVDENSERVFAMEEKINSLKAENKTAEADALEDELESLTKRKQNDQRLLSYARSLIKKILKVGKKEDYAKLQKIYVPGLIPEKEISPEDSSRVSEKLEVNDIPAVIAETVTKKKKKTESEVPRDPTDVVDASPEPNSEREEGIVTPPLQPADLDDENEKDNHKAERKKDRQKNDRAKNSLATDEKAMTPAVGDTTASSHADQADLDPEKAGTGVALTGKDTLALTSPDAPERTQVNDSMIDDESSAGVTIPEAKTEDEPTDSAVGMSADADTSKDLAAGTDMGHVQDKGKESQVKMDSQETSSNTNVARYIGSPKNRWFSQEELSMPGYECDYEFQGTDEFTKQQKKELREELFFTHTDERLKPYLKTRDYVTCNGYLTSISGGFRYLTLIIKIASRNAVREYGNIRNGSLLNLKLLDEETVSLFSQSESQGLQDPKTGDTVYKIRYPIDYQKEKILLKTGVDKVRIVWSSGYEDYEVFNVDFFINQLNCLNSK